MNGFVRRLLIFFLVMTVMATSGIISHADTINTAFTYQGQLKYQSKTVTGVYDFQYELYDSLTGGEQVGNTLSINDVNVINGVFSVTLDFGGNVFSSGTAYWLQIAVKGENNENYSTLSPRQAINPVPYALYSETVGDASITSSKLANGAVTGDKIDNGAITADKLDTAGAAAGDVLSFDGNSPVWGQGAAAAKGPLAYGHISSSGQKSSGSDNVSAQETAIGRYVITIEGEDYQPPRYFTMVTPNASDLYRIALPVVSHEDGKLVVYIYDLDGHLTSFDFNFITYKNEAGKFYRDDDGDGYGVSDDFINSSISSDPYTAYVDGDCDDTNYSIHPGIDDICNGFDDDCDGGVDEDVTGYITCGTGACYHAVPACEDGAPGTCDPMEGASEEVCDGIDNDCDYEIDEGCGLVRYYKDMDGDGYGNSNDYVDAEEPYDSYTAEIDGDCDDSDANINPMAEEVYNGIDDDCDQEVDEGLGTTIYYADLDGDGYGDSSDYINSTVPFNIYTAEFGGDCDDENSGINPMAIELHNSFDDDCDGLIDERIYYQDMDGDGYGNSYIFTEAISPQYPYTTYRGGDCNDTNANINPMETEACNGFDDDCDGFVDEGCGLIRYYADMDGDGYGNSNDYVDAEEPYDSYTAEIDGDCDDSDANINPMAEEVYNGIDDDCDQEVDEGLGTTIYYADLDGDGYGDSSDYIEATEPEHPYTAEIDGDCNDGDANVNPMAEEVCDGIDNDCDGNTDEDCDCDDHDPCTIDQYIDGNCIHTPACVQDWNPCLVSIGVCSVVDGVPQCSYDALSGVPCDDGDPFTINDTCYDGTCIGEPMECDDGNSCTIDYYDPQNGCIHANKANGTACEDGNACTALSKCIDGVCTGTAVNCDDGDPCTTDYCDPINGCTHTEIPGCGLPQSMSQPISDMVNGLDINGDGYIDIFITAGN